MAMLELLLLIFPDRAVHYVASNASALIDGLIHTVLLSLFAMALAVAWGLILVIPRLFRIRWISVPVLAYIELFRNTPLLIQVYLIYFGLPLIGVPLSAFLCGVLAIALQHGAFLAEIYRGGIESISKHQWQASRALGLRTGQLMRLVILPQAFNKLVPALTNQLIILVKDTSVIAAIGVMELTLTGKILVERSGASFQIFVIIALIYLSITSLLGFFLRVLELRRREQ